ncbi:hypothetical protein [Alkalihalobacillus sp. CinArs1]|uniref:hypothetical protein n=1 Tax=Alkalihalobacillus sp. CinArs1 TaxID=2995314 RepID=UPI0022DD1AB3|nr:hypothetical protein [Alkalihalobacillus sp. CinArs1]
MYFHYRPPYIPPNRYVPSEYLRPMPPVQVTRFQASAGTCLHLMEEGRKLLNKVHDDHHFAHELKDAAQSNDHTYVHSLIRSTGVQSALKTTYTPDAIRIDLHTGDESDCSELSIKLCW